MEGFEGRVYSGRYGGIGCHAFAVVTGTCLGALQGMYVHRGT